MLLDVRGVASFADYFVVATAVNARHMRALVETLLKDLRGEKIRPEHQEGAAEAGWVLLDYGDVIVHIFSPELREHYALEDLWQAAREIVRIQ